MKGWKKGAILGVFVLGIVIVPVALAEETLQDSTFPACIDYNLSQDECDRVIKWITDCEQIRSPEECEKSGYELAELIVEFKVGERRWEQLNESEKERIMEETWELSMNVEYTPPDPEYGEIIDRLEREYGRLFTKLLFRMGEKKFWSDDESFDRIQFARDFEGRFNLGNETEISIDQNIAEIDYDLLIIDIFPREVVEISKGASFTSVKKITLKNVGGELIYEVNGVKEGKFLFIFPVRAEVDLIIDANTGEIESSTKMPWWGTGIFGRLVR